MTRTKAYREYEEAVKAAWIIYKRNGNFVDFRLAIMSQANAWRLATGRNLCQI